MILKWRYQWWPVQVRVADHVSSKRRWWIEQGGVFPDIRYLATVFSLWRFRIAFGNRRTVPYTDHRPMSQPLRIALIVTTCISLTNLAAVVLAVVGRRQNRSQGG